ncbi:protein takeout [Prorops nasuta]|uniref:protein takeout n=1 Tax=Prorops nasuta TaxID=863751 RepID=UPI0034CF4BEB
MRNLLILLLLAAVTTFAAAKDLPVFIKVCKKNDPNVEACIQDSVENLKPFLMRGLPEYNIPSLEPLLLKELVATEGTGGIRITARNVRAYGASDFSITRLKVDLEEQKFAVDIALPHLHMEGNYEIDGRVLLLPIRGSGPMSGNFSECTGAVRFRGVVEKNEADEDHLKISEFRLKISIGRGRLHLDNLFGGERVLGDVINSAINSNFDTFIRELQPLVENVLSDAFLEIANSIVGQFTYQQLFPEK